MWFSSMGHTFPAPYQQGNQGTPSPMKKPTTLSLLKRALLLAALAVCGPFLTSSTAQYIGVTCGWQYSAQLTGPPTYPNQQNISLYNPDPSNPNMTWDSWAEQLAQAGVDFVCPNLTGSQPHAGDPPSDMAPLVATINARGLANKIKFAAFDDNAASWCAQWNLANGRGYGYAQPIDMANPANWVYLYDYNYKKFFEVVPDANRFKINGRPVIIIWTANPTFIGNAQGNLSQALDYVRQKCQQDFGFNPYIIGNEDFLTHDTTCNNTGKLDATHRWFGPPSDPYTLSIFRGVKVGAGVAQFQHPGQGGYLDPNHGQLLNEGLGATVGDGALITLLEGFTDYEEDAALFRVRNLDTNGTALTYSQTGYDYPNQRINLMRKYSREPVPASMKFEAEGCDTYGGAAGGNGLTNYYRNGNIAIQATTDTGGGHNVGWMQTGQWFEWKDVPLNGTPRFHLRVATPNAGRTAHLVIDGSVKATKTLPNTGNWQTYTTFDMGTYGSFTGLHTIRIVFSNGGVNFNWWQTSGGTALPPVAGPGTNLALNKTVTASSTDGVNLAPRVNDGNTPTRWASVTGSDNQWIQVDLGSSQTVRRVTLRWEFAYGQSYKIQTSTNGTTWTDRFTTTTGNGGIDKITFTAATARYVRMQGVLRGTPHGYSLYEMEVYTN